MVSKFGDSLILAYITNDVVEDKFLDNGSIKSYKSSFSNILCIVIDQCI